MLRLECPAVRIHPFRSAALYASIVACRIGVFGFLAMLSVRQLPAEAAAIAPKMLYSDNSRLGRPFAKDPSVVKFRGSYWMYYSLPPASRERAASDPGAKVWGIGIAESTDLTHWKKAGEVRPALDVEKVGIAAPGARVIDGKVHLFYQTYGLAGAGRLDAICHAVSTDAIHFDPDPGNPVYRPTKMPWSAGRAIDAEVYPNNNELWLFFATRDLAMKTQEIGMAAAPIDSGFGKGVWRDLSVVGPVLKPELPWEQDCLEAPTILRHGDYYYLFYAGAYNNRPQQIGVARSRDGSHWTRLGTAPFLPNGNPGAWNSSESGHPGVFVDDDGRTYLFYQGNNDHGHTWLISMVELRWNGDTPYMVAP